MTRKHMLLQYILNQSIFFDNDCTERQNNMVYHHSCDEVDCLEMIIAKTRRDLFNQIARDILHMYHITDKDLEDFAEVCSPDI